MQDSSTNPYIPQENTQIRAATQTLSSPLKRMVKLLMIITGVLALVIAVGLIVVIPRTATTDPATRVDLAHALQPTGQLSRLVPVTSSLGFSLRYDNQLFVSYAETVPPVDANGKEGSSAYYENDELRTARDYDLVRITPAESADSDRAAVADPPQLIVSSEITADTLKQSESKPDYKGLSQLALFVKLSTDARLAAKTADDGTTVSIDATKPSSQTINDVKYQKVRFTTKNENYRITNQKYDDCYYTIQHDTPISACITGVRPNSRDDAALVEMTLKSLSFQEPKEAIVEESTSSSGETTKTTKESTDKKEADATRTTPEEEPQALVTPKPEYTTNFDSLSVIAKNQPSAVRIGTLYCADLNLKVASGDVITTLTDACVGNLASGTVVSQDGYIATTGHAVRHNPKEAINGYINFADSQKDLLDRLDRVLDYLLKARLILESDADYLRTGAQIGDQEAMAKIENISSIIPDNYVTPTKDAYSYAIQPTDKPLAVDASTGSRPAFAYSDSVIAAKFVAADYDVKSSLQATFDAAAPAKDIGLLKAEGSFQNVPVGQGSQLASNDVVNGIGFPSFSDSLLVIGKNHNAPIVTNAKVNQTYNNDNTKLIQLDSPIVPGTDGGGVFNQAGALAGFGVYGLSYCADQQCFAAGTVRPSDELTALVEEKNLTLGELSQATTTWHDGVDEYFKGNYAGAQAAFTKAGGIYGYNRFAEPLAKLAASKKGSASDTSLMNQLRGVMIGTLVLMTVLTVVFAIVFVLQKRRLDHLHVGHYGVETAPYVPTVAAAPQAYTPQPPAQVAQPQSPQEVPAPPYQPQPPVQSPYMPQPPVQPQQPQQQPPQSPPQVSPQQPDDPFYRQ